MKKSTKFVALLLVLVLLLGGAIGGTIAYLTDKSETVENTFTAGDVSITLVESDNLDLKMVPGKEIKKDPKVTVSADSEDCYVFVKVEAENGVILSSATVNAATDYITYAIADGWTKLDGVDGVYYLVADTAEEKGEAISVLDGDKVTVLTTVTKDMMTDVKDGTAKEPELSFTAYAIQSAYLTDRNSDGDVDEEDAWAWIKNPNP